MADELPASRIPSLRRRPQHTLLGPPFHEDRPLDGQPVRAGGVHDCCARLHPALVRVRVTGQRCTTRSWLDGAMVALWEADPEDAADGHRVIVEPWMLSAAPVDEVLKRLREGGDSSGLGLCAEAHLRRLKGPAAKSRGPGGEASWHSMTVHARVASCSLSS